MDRTYKVDILPPAQAELEEIARIHLALLLKLRDVYVDIWYGIYY